MPDWLQWVLSGVFAPITTGLTALTGHDSPVTQIMEGSGGPSYGQFNGSTDLGPAAFEPNVNPDVQDLGGANIPMSVDVQGDSGSTDSFDTQFADAMKGSPSLAQYIQENPDLNPEDYFKFMANNSDEWAEKWIDYVLEKQSIDEQNQYLASREDTAYQRLVSDLKKAGLNPAMMYGSSASPQGGSSVGVVKASEGANSRSIGNYDKLKKLILGYMLMQLNASLGLTNMTGKSLISLIGSLK